MATAADVILAAGNIAIDLYEAEKASGLADADARAKAIDGLKGRFLSGDADLTAALADQPVPEVKPA